MGQREAWEWLRRERLRGGRWFGIEDAAEVLKSSRRSCWRVIGCLRHQELIEYKMTSDIQNWRRLFRARLEKVKKEEKV